jgi:GNAT superfamily N-acetyltransferase
VAPLSAPDRLLLERLGADAWPALEEVVVDGWRLRASAGVTRRANSALPLSDALPVDEVVDFYRSRGLPPVVQVSDPRTDRALAELGWTSDVEVDVMTGPVHAQPQERTGVTEPTEPTTARVLDEPDQAWLDTWWTVDGRGGPAELAVARRMLARIAAPAGYACVVQDGQPVAVGRGVVQEGWLGVFSMGVLPVHRRRGLGRQVLHALGTWAAAHGAEAAYLQVFRGNHAARALYASAGFALAHRYHYRSLP